MANYNSVEEILAAGIFDFPIGIVLDQVPGLVNLFFIIGV